jgi:hypothetical protein
MKKLLLTSIAALLLATGAAQATETLTLACKGTVGPIDHNKPREPISMGVVVNFTDWTVHGFDAGGMWFGGSKDQPAKVTNSTETEIYFEGKGRSFGFDRIVSGTIDRVTGDIEASSHLEENGRHVPFDEGTMYELKCKPTQRMF